MKLHTSLSATDVQRALDAAYYTGKVAANVTFVQFTPSPSRSCRHGYLVQLGSYDQSIPEGTTDQHGKVMRVRRFKNSGDNGAFYVWAATYDEWGWFIARIFALDPKAKFGPYRGPLHFHQETEGKFLYGLRMGTQVR